MEGLAPSSALVSSSCWCSWHMRAGALVTRARRRVRRLCGRSRAVMSSDGADATCCAGLRPSVAAHQPRGRRGANGWRVVCEPKRPRPSVAPPSRRRQVRTQQHGQCLAAWREYSTFCDPWVRDNYFLCYKHRKVNIFRLYSHASVCRCSCATEAHGGSSPRRAHRWRRYQTAPHICVRAHGRELPLWCGSRCCP